MIVGIGGEKLWRDKLKATLFALVVTIVFAAMGAPLARAEVAYYNHEVSNNPHVYLVFWGKNWNEYSGARTEIREMFAHLSGSSWQSVLTQYFDHTGPISSEVGLSSWTDQSIAAPSSVNNTHLEAEIEYSISQQSWPGGGINNLYFVLPAPGSGYDTTEKGAWVPECARHYYFGAIGSPFAWAKWPGDDATCNQSDPAGENRPWASLSVAASHEYAEAVTDPQGLLYLHEKTGWVQPGEITFRIDEQGHEVIDGPSREIADLCEGQAHLGYMAGYPVEELWDNHLGQCAIGDQNPPQYYATTLPAGSFSASTHSTILNGTVDPGGHATTYEFQWGTSTSYGNTTSAQSAGSGETPTGVNGTVSGLKGNTTYHYRTVAHNSQGYEVWGQDQAFTTPDWRPGLTTEAPASVTTEGATLKGTVNPQGYSTTYHFEYGTTTSYGTNVPVPDASAGSGISATAVSRAISGLKPETTYHFRITATNQEGTTSTADRTFTTKAVPPIYLSSFGSKGTGNGQLQRPLGIARDSSGNLWLADADNNRIEEFNAKGEYVFQFGSKGSGNGQLSEPRDLAFTPQGNIWVSDAGNGRIEEFNAKGEYLQQAGISEGLSDHLTQPYGIVVDSQGRIWVCDFGGARVVRFNESATLGDHYVASYTPQIGQPALTNPAGIAIDSQGTMWLTDWTNNKVYKLAYESGWGTYVMSYAFGSTGSGEGQFTEPRGIAARPSGNLLIADKANNRVQVLSPTGEYLGSFGSSGSGQMLEPRTVTLGSNGAIYVADSGNNRIERWVQPSKPEASTLPASNLAATSATLNGTVNPDGAATAYRFEYGKTTSYGTSVPVPDESVGSGVEAVAVSKAISGLSAETAYHYRLVATNSEGAAYGADQTFTPTAPMSAIQANDHYLWVYSPTIGANNTALGMKAATSPAVTMLAGGGHEAAFQDDQGNLWVYSTTGATGTGLGMLAATSPAIAPTSSGGYVVAFQANTGTLWTYSSASGSKNTGFSMKSGTSPAIAVMPDGSYRVAYQATTGELMVYSSATGQSSAAGISMLAATSPSIAPTPSGGYVVAAQASSGVLWTYSSASGTKNTTLTMKSGTSPAIATVSDGSYRVAYSTSANELAVYSSATGSKTATGLSMLAGTSPAIEALPAGAYEAAFQAANTNLKLYRSAGTSQEIELGMMSATGPGIG